MATRAKLTLVTPAESTGLPVGEAPVVPISQHTTDSQQLMTASKPLCSLRSFGKKNVTKACLFATITLVSIIIFKRKIF